MVERFNGRIAEVLRTHHFRSRKDLESVLKRYVWLYNHHSPPKAHEHDTPIPAMKLGTTTPSTECAESPGTRQLGILSRSGR